MALSLVCDSRRVTLSRDMLVAATPYQRIRGLIGRDLPLGSALQLPGAKQVHTLGLKVPIDVIFCDRDLEVLHICKRLAPRRVTRWVRRAHVAFELPAGSAGCIETGDRLELTSHLSSR